jgi:hypothetical protein
MLETSDEGKGEIVLREDGTNGKQRDKDLSVCMGVRGVWACNGNKLVGNHRIESGHGDGYVGDFPPFIEGDGLTLVSPSTHWRRHHHRYGHGRQSISDCLSDLPTRCLPAWITGKRAMVVSSAGYSLTRVMRTHPGRLVTLAARELL